MQDGELKEAINNAREKLTCLHFNNGFEEGIKYIIKKTKKEIDNITLIIEDWEEEYKLLSNHVDNYNECDDLFEQIRKYINYKKALEQVVNNFPIEVGSY